MLKHIVAVGAVLVIAACSGSSSGGNHASPKNPCANPANPCGNPCNPCAANPCNPCAGGAAGAAPSAETDVDWTSWQSWTKLNATPMPSKGHKSTKWVDVYVPADQAAAYRSLAAPFAAGTRVVKAHLADDGGTPGKVTALTVMAKMKAGFDADNGDWYYGVLSADGKKIVGPEGKVKMCIGCHDAADSDFIFGLPK